MLGRLMRMGWRNLSRNRRRTWITAAALGGGMALSTFTWVYTDGYLQDMLNLMVGTTSGHVQIQPPGQIEEANLYDTLPDTPGTIAALQADPRVKGLAPRIESAALLAQGEDAAGARIIGLDPALEAGSSRLPDQIQSGHFLSGPGQVVLGVDLARRIGAQVGGQVVAVSQGADGSTASAMWDVVGTVKTGLDSDDRGAAWISLDEAESFFVIDGAHRIMVTLKDGDQADAFAADWGAHPGWTRVVSEAHPAQDAEPTTVDAPAGEDRWSQPNTTPEDPGATDVIRTWRAINPVMSQTESMAQSYLLLVVFIVLGTAGMGALNTMLMSVLERTRELGILMAVGLKPVHVVLMIVFESFSLSLLALVVGLPLAGLLSWWMVDIGMDFSDGFGDIVYAGVAMEPVFRGRWSVDAFVIPTVMLVAISVAASLWPAIRAARLDPVDAMGRK